MDKKFMLTLGLAGILSGGVGIQGVFGMGEQHATVGKAAKYLIATDREALALSKITVATGAFKQVATGFTGNPDSIAYITSSFAIVSSTTSTGVISDTGLLLVNFKTNAMKWLVQGGFGPRGPFDITMRPDQSGVVMSIRDDQSGSCQSAAVVDNYNLHTGKVTALVTWQTLGLPEAYDFDPNGLVFLPDGSLYLATRYKPGCSTGQSAAGKIWKINPKTGKVLGSWPAQVGSSPGADGLTYDPLSKKIYAGGVDRVIRFDPATGTVDTLVSGFPYDPDGNGAPFNGVDGVEADAAGNIYAADVCFSSCNTTMAGIWKINSRTGKMTHVITPNFGDAWDDLAPLTGTGSPPTPTPIPTATPTVTPTPRPHDIP